MIKSILASDHAAVDHLLDEAVAALDAADMDEAFQKSDLFWARLAMHIRAEHLHLFPAVLRSQSAGPESAALVARLHSDHDIFMRELIAVIKQFRSLGGESLDVADIRKRLETVRTLLAVHNRIEEEKIYVDERLGLAPNELAQLASSIQHEITNLPPRFRTA